MIILITTLNLRNIRNLFLNNKQSFLLRDYNKNISINVSNLSGNAVNFSSIIGPCSILLLRNIDIILFLKLSELFSSFEI